MTNIRQFFVHIVRPFRRLGKTGNSNVLMMDGTHIPHTFVVRQLFFYDTSEMVNCYLDVLHDFTRVKSLGPIYVFSMDTCLLKPCFPVMLYPSRIENFGRSIATISRFIHIHMMLCPFVLYILLVWMCLFVYHLILFESFLMGCPLPS